MMKIPKPYNKSQLSWALFDWANQPFFTVVTTFIFAPYFVNQVVNNAVDGQAMWGYINAIVAFSIALCSPIFGAMADVRGPRKPWVAILSVMCAVASCGLWYAQPNGNILIPLISFGIATFAIEIAVIFNHAMLPTIVEEKRLGRLSGFSWGVGYIGGVVALLLLLILFIWADKPLFGLNKDLYEPERISGPLSALWLIIFTIPMLLFTPDVNKSNEKIASLDTIKLGFSNLKNTLTDVKAYKNIWTFLLARAFYNDGVLAVISFSGIYAMATFGWDTTSLGIFAILINIIAFFGCLIGGAIDDKFGSKTAIRVSVWALFIALFGIVSITKNSALFGLIDFQASNNAAFLSTPAQIWFMGFGLILGMGFGPAQSASRTMMVRITPKEKITQFFGLYAFSGKATGFLAPLAIGIVTASTGSIRMGMSVILVFFFAGLAMLHLVKEK